MSRHTSPHPTDAEQTAIALTIAGSDSGGGAGIQADLKAFSALGVYGASVITAITAQNTRAVTAVHDIPVDIVSAQIDAVLNDIVHHQGSQVLSMQRDRRDIERFARLTENHQWIDKSVIESLEPDLAQRFNRGFYFAQEAHLDRRNALQQLISLSARKVDIRFDSAVSIDDCDGDRIIDCRGFGAKSSLTDSVRQALGYH